MHVLGFLFKDELEKILQPRSTTLDGSFLMEPVFCSLKGSECESIMEPVFCSLKGSESESI